MIARVQLSLIEQVNNRDVTKREKKIDPNDKAVHFFKTSGAKKSAEIMRPSNDDVEKKQDNNIKTRANPIPRSHAMVFGGLGGSN